MLVCFAVSEKNKDEDIWEADPEEQEMARKNTQRIKGNIVYLMAQGALHALGIKALAQAYQPMILYAAASSGDYLAFIVVMAANVLAFLPLTVSTARTTGVYQAVGMTLEFVVGVLAPTWYLALIFGAVVVFAEVWCIGLLDGMLNKLPGLRACGDHIRAGMAQTLSIALVIGSALSAYAMWEVTGLAILGVVYVINDAVGQRVPRNAVGPLTCVGIGLLLNLLTVLGIAF